MDLAHQLGLEEAGAGAIRGLFTRKQVTLFKASLATKDRRMETVLYSSEELKDDELILGVPDMIALGIFDACKCQFHVESCYKVNAVSLVEEEKSDQDLLAVAKQLITDMTSHLEGVVRGRLWGLLQKHSKCWLRPRTGRTRHSVELEVDGKPVKHTLKPLRPELREELDKQIDDMLSMGVIQPSNSSWGARPVFVRKKTGEWRMCIDYRALNKGMALKAYPIPLLWEGDLKKGEYVKQEAELLGFILCFLLHVFNLLVEAIKAAGHDGKVKIGTDIAASEFFKEGGLYDLDFKNKDSDKSKWLKGEELVKVYMEFVDKYPMVLDEHAEGAWKQDPDCR
ncbi:enolase [Gregarina niphandrodes]|uniref:phosphopyruvate hydratase n=1 Tax=Gregarina niphandrodes TaxID=110365 RepID=A0A023AXC8_GRENI|nr:enolase [Gregarina niphandrodes]EZG43262.1 enolase [Gregarina niphandrodes]|eukprot:XP_011133481.1 enolase [Gregarina niphandrodes]